MYEDCTSAEGPRRMTGLGWSRSPWWLGCRWMWGFLRARLISFSRRGSGPSLIRASYAGREPQTGAQHHRWQADECSPPPPPPYIPTPSIPAPPAPGRHLAELGQDLPKQSVQRGELPAEVDVALKAAAVGEGVQVGDLVQELLHAGPLQLQELVHEGHVLLLAAKPATSATFFITRSVTRVGPFRSPTLPARECPAHPQTPSRVPAHHFVQCQPVSPSSPSGGRGEPGFAATKVAVTKHHTEKEGVF